MAFNKKDKAGGLLRFLQEAQQGPFKDRWTFDSKMLKMEGPDDKYNVQEALVDKDFMYLFYVGTIIEVSCWIKFNLMMLLELIYCTYINTSLISWHEGIILALTKGDKSKSIVENFCTLLCQSEQKSASARIAQQFTTSAGRSYLLLHTYLFYTTYCRFAISRQVMI